MASTQINGGTQIQAGTITNAQIAPAAAISSSKLADGSNFLKKDGSVVPTADLPIGGFKLTGVADPINPQDAATKNYVDAARQGLDMKASVRAATTAALPANTYANGAAGAGATLTGNSNAALAAQDGVTLLVNERLLVKNEAAPANNGIYQLTQVGSGALPYILTRVADADTTLKVTAGMHTFVEEGTTQADTGWVLTTDGALTIGTTAQAFTQFSSSGTITASTGLTKVASDIRAVAGNGIDGSFPGGAIVVKPSDTSIVVAAGGISVSTAFVTSHKVTRETPSGTINGSTTVFTLAFTPVAGTEEVYLNGILQDAGAGNDYTISGTSITMLAAPLAGDKLRVNYWK